jgi:hypothetical protein
VIEDVRETDVIDASQWPLDGIADAGHAAPPPLYEASRRVGLEALRAGSVAVVTLAAGAGSRWTQGAGVVKALHPFCKLSGQHRTFIELHLARSRRIAQLHGATVPHIITTSHLTHEPIREFLDRTHNHGYQGPLVPLTGTRGWPAAGAYAVRDLRFAWEEMPQQILDEQQQKVRESLHAALIQWARTTGEASDYTQNLPLQCLHPVGHWFEIPNLFRNGVLAQLLHERPQLRHLLLHNIDTLGANLDPVLLGLHLQNRVGLTFEVITRRLEDRGGGLARVDGRPRLVEGLALPREDIEFQLSYYNSMSTWIDIDRLLDTFELSRADLLRAFPHPAGKSTVEPSPEAAERIHSAIRKLAARMPTYITLKDVKKRWGQGQEDVFPVVQFEKLWSDLSALPEIQSAFVVVPRPRGQQLKDQSQLDGWLRDGSADFVQRLCDVVLIPLWECPTVHTLIVDAKKRIRLPDAEPNQVFAYERPSEGRFVLTRLVKAEPDEPFPRGSLSKYLTRAKAQEELALLKGCSLEVPE